MTTDLTDVGTEPETLSRLPEATRPLCGGARMQSPALPDPERLTLGCHAYPLGLEEVVLDPQGGTQKDCMKT